jgi:Sulfotransferase domain
MVRYEDLCRKPAETVSELMRFLGKPAIDIVPLIEGIRDVGNIGRWRHANVKGFLAPGMQADLQRFGYEV